MQLHSTQNWENTSEEPKWFLEKLIHNITNFDLLILEFKNNNKHDTEGIETVHDLQILFENLQTDGSSSLAGMVAGSINQASLRKNGRYLSLTNSLSFIIVCFKLFLTDIDMMIQVNCEFKKKK